MKFKEAIWRNNASTAGMIIEDHTQVRWYSSPLKHNIKEPETMNTYDVSAKHEHIMNILNSVRGAIKSDMGKKDKAVYESGKAFAKNLVKHLRQFSAESLDEFEADCCCS